VDLDLLPFEGENQQLNVDRLKLPNEENYIPYDLIDLQVHH
jgi:hypothetical protein